jgi:signal transduction histidine kinase
MLADEETDAATRARYARNMLGAVAHGRHLVEQILAFARGEQRRHVPIDTRRIVAVTLELLRVTLPACVHLRESIGAEPLTIMADADQLQRMVTNLCGNAVHAMKDGGFLHVALAGIETASPVALSHGTLEPGRYVRIRVEDAGCGMDEATLGRIFEPLFSTKAPGQGSGLGLAVVQRIVADLAGAIDVKSIPGAGSVFSIYIPAARP